MSLLRTEYLLSAVNGVTNRTKILNINQRDFFYSELLSHGSITMVKVLSFSSGQFFNPSTMLLVKGSSETGLFRHLSNNVFGSS